METRTEYEKRILKEVREMPDEVLPQVVKIIHSLKEGVLYVKVHHKKREAKESGLCGIWKDERPAAEIIACAGWDLAVERLHCEFSVKG